MGKMRLLAVLSVLLHVALGIPSLDLFESDPDVIIPRSPRDIEYRLSDDITPSEYDVTIRDIDFQNFTFTGAVTITFVANVNATTIKMHSRVNIVSFNIDNGPDLNNSSFELITDKHFVVFDATVVQGVTYRISIRYTAVIQDDMSGFYRSWYKQGSNIEWMGSTQFQPVYARKVFPCFDEPKFKAVFKINIECPTNYNCVSNMPERETTGGIIHFHDTPIMSSYLIAFMVSKFENAAGNTTETKYRILARPEANDMGNYAFITGENIINVLGNHLDFNYTDMDVNMKMDHAAIPDFSAGAMENWGLVTYREAYLMYKAGETSPRYKQQVATILAHEITHMWFGNLVTCNWWSNTWLNEGFATFFQYFVSLESENMGLEDQFVVSQLQAALAFDTTINSSPMSDERVNTPNQISNHFSTISYQKGGSIIRMIEHLIGKENFRLGLANHLETRKYQNAVPDDLFTALNSEADLTEYDNTTVKEVMESWTSKSGYPLLHVTVNHGDESVTLRQERFSKEGETADQNILYNIPITFTTGDEYDFSNTTPEFVMTEKDMTFSERFSHDFYLFNIQQTGFYRVNYDRANWYRLADVLQKNRTGIHRYNRAQIVDDAMNLAREGRMNYTMMLDIIEFLESETEYAPWQAAFNGFSFLRLQFGKNSTAAEKIDELVHNLMEELVKDIGVDGDGDHLKRLFRGNAMNLACNVKNEQCVNSAKDLFAKLISDTPVKVNPDIREYVYCNGLRYGGDAEYDYLWNKYITDNVVSERVVILGALGCTKQQNKVMDFLLKTMDPIEHEIRDQDRMSAFNSALTGNQENALTVLEFLKENTVEIRELYNEVGGLFSSLTGRMTEAQLVTLEAYLAAENELTPEEINDIRTNIQSARNVLRWAESKHEEVISWIDEKYNGAGSIVVSLSLLVTMLTALFMNH